MKWCAAIYNQIMRRYPHKLGSNEGNSKYDLIFFFFLLFFIKNLVEISNYDNTLTDM
jgi:hypothetical protein